MSTGAELRRTRRVLVVDDDPGMRMLVREALEPEGLVVEEAADGEEALQCFARNSADLVLLDVQMPRRDGFSVCAWIRSRRGAEHTPVVMMTGNDDVASIRHAYDVGATDFVTKPLNWLILSHRVHYLLRASDNLGELRRSQERLASAQRLARIGSFQFDAETGALEASSELRAILGLETDAKPIAPRDVLDLVHPADRSDVEDAARACLEAGAGARLELRLVLAGGSQRIVHCQAQTVRDVAGRPALVEGTIQDVTEHKRAEEQIRYLAHHDTVTGLGNRLLFQQRCDIATAQARRSGVPFGLLLLDLDHFKRINDTLGHSFGDRILQGVADRLVTSVRDSDCIARGEIGTAISRIGGDEFTILLTQLRDPQDLATAARRILDAVSRPFALGEHEVVVSGSIGIAAWPGDGEDVETLSRNADAAMYHAKEKGRNNYQFYAESMNAVALRRLILEGKLRRALDQGEFLLHYQPKISAESGAIVGVEALLRWRDPDQGIILPALFIPIAEETGLIEPLGEWALREACAQVTSWRQQGLPAVSVSVNLSIHQFRGGSLAERVGAVLEETGMDPRRLELEITESVLLNDQGAVAKELATLRRRGVQVSIDDFGTGYSSFAYLRHLPLDALKIDRSFVADVATDPDAAALVAAIVSMGHALRLRVVAEGVETAEQRDLLVRFGCDEMQGFFFDRPGDAWSIAAHWLARREPE